MRGSHKLQSKLKVDGGRGSCKTGVGEKSATRTGVTKPICQCLLRGIVVLHDDFWIQSYRQG